MNLFIFLSLFILIKFPAAETNDICNHGQLISTVNETEFDCKCDRGWINSKDQTNYCNYEQKSQLASFLLSFFLGLFGADWYYLSVGNGGYIAGAIFKMLTLGGFGIWWLVDWIRILTNAFPDGNGQPLLPWNP
ncbi:unnamed protein product [Adineta ricciae]|uniref:TM2 domain-containing protein n=1 Tax=Adineta ricciae TaxID=249248 RepID=A0A813W5K7_ADIRI|nr:unnamed protein product [Adineta ricciae]CAF1506993.1 unnamed protein product [Adineta ricciae]